MMSNEKPGYGSTVITALILLMTGSLLVASPATVAVVIACLVIFCLPGIPVTNLLRNGEAWPPAMQLAWICVTGYFLSTCSAVAILALFPDAHGIVMLWPVLLTPLIACYAQRRRPGPIGTINVASTANIEGTVDPPNRSFRSRQAELIAVTLIMILALIATLPPLVNIGREFPEGRFFRAYFNVDYLKHAAVTAHLAHAEIPPDNPYLKTAEPLHYYWFFYVFPGSVRGLDLSGIETLDILRVVTIWGILTFCLLLFGVCRRISRSIMATFVAVFCGLFASSYEGLFLWHKIAESGEPLLQGIGKYNVDAATRWFIGHPQIDGLYRTLIFTPQHLIGLMLFCVSIITFCDLFSVKTRPAAGRLWFGGLMIGLTFGFSSFIGIVGYLWLTVLACFMVVQRRSLRIGVHLALSLLLSMLILAALGILYRRPESLMFLPQTAVISNLPRFLVFNFGPLLFLFFAGIFRGLRLHRSLVLNLLFLLMMCLFFILFIQIQNFPTDMGIKLGLIVSTAFIFLIAIGLDADSARVRKYLLLIAVILIVPAIPTLVLDVYNCSDPSNPRYSTLVEHEDLAACRWIRDHLPENVRIQSDPYERYEAYSLIPTFAERRTVVGDKMHARIFLSDPAAFETYENQVDDLFRATDPATASALMRELGIDYVFAGRTERRKYPSSTELFSNFVTVYRADGVSVHSNRLLASLKDISFTRLAKPIPPETGSPPSIPDTIPPDNRKESGLDTLSKSDSLSSAPDFPDDSIATHAVIDSADPSTPHHFMVKSFLVDSDGIIRSRFGDKIFPLEPGESGRFNMGAFKISNALEPGDYVVRLELFHVPDSMDSFLPKEYSIVDMHRRFHTTGAIEGEGDRAQVVARHPDHAPGIVARGSFGVLPAGDYTLTIPSKDCGDHSTCFDKAEWVIIVDGRSFIRRSGVGSNDDIVMHFTLNQPSDTQAELRLLEGGSLSARTVRLEWIARRPASAPLATMEQRIHFDQDRHFSTKPLSNKVL